MHLIQVNLALYCAITFSALPELDFEQAKRCDDDDKNAMLYKSMHEQQN